jgi:hypothetical protein
VSGDKNDNSTERSGLLTSGAKSAIETLESKKQSLSKDLEHTTNNIQIMSLGR